MKVFKNDIDIPTALSILREYVPLIAVDVETTGLDPLKDELKVVTIWNIQKQKGYYIKVNGKAENLSNLLMDKRLTTVFHHAMFDCKFIYKHLGAIVFNPHCTKVLAKIIDPMRVEGSQKLSELLYRYEVADIKKDMNIATGDWSIDPTEEMLQYAQDDVQYLDELHKRMAQRLNHTQKLDYHTAREQIPFMVYSAINYNGGLYSY
jgi:ribonuclease D